MIKECLSCKRMYHYDFEECIFCFKILKERTTEKVKVRNFTEVTISTADHQDTPYFVILAEDNEGNLFLEKSKVLPQLGDIIEIGEKKPVAAVEGSKDKFKTAETGDKKSSNSQNLLFPSS